MVAFVDGVRCVAYSIAISINARIVAPGVPSRWVTIVPNVRIVIAIDDLLGVVYEVVVPKLVVRRFVEVDTVSAVCYIVSANIVVRCSKKVEAITSVSYVVFTYDISVAIILDSDTPSRLAHIYEVSANNVIAA